MKLYGTQRKAWIKLKNINLNLNCKFNVNVNTLQRSTQYKITVSTNGNDI